MEIKDRIEQFVNRCCDDVYINKNDFESELLELLKEVASDSYGAGFVASYDASKEDFSDYWSDFLTNIEQDGK